MRFHHLGIVAESVEIGKLHLGNLLGTLEWTAPVADPIQRVQVLFAVDASGICFELIVPSMDTSPVSASLRSRKNILNHVAYKVDDLDFEESRLRAHGCIALGPASPATAFDGARIQFHVNPLGLLVELIEEKPR